MFGTEVHGEAWVKDFLDDLKHATDKDDCVSLYNRLSYVYFHVKDFTCTQAEKINAGVVRSRGLTKNQKKLKLITYHYVDETESDYDFSF